MSGAPENSAGPFGSCPLPQSRYDHVLLGHGSGGKLTADLIQRVFLPALGNDVLCRLEDQARRLSVKVGDALTIAAPTSRGMNNTADVKVAVIARNVGLLSAFNAFLPAETLRQLYQLNDRTTGAIQLYLKDASRSTANVRRSIERIS